jgi:xylan 1,4-beta-xylosidase
MIKIFGDTCTQSGVDIYTDNKPKSFSGNKFYLIHLLKGHLKLVFLKEEFELKSDEIFLIKEGEDFILKPMENVFLFIYSFSAFEIDSFPIFVTQKIVLDKNSGMSLSDSLTRLEKSLQQIKTKISFETIALSYQMLDRLNIFSVKEKTLQHEKRINEIVEFIKSYYFQELSLEVIAEHFNLSRSYFSRYFRKEMGINYLEYLTSFRLEKAAQKIRNSKDRISRIAMEVGFENVNNFNLRFKKKYNATPLEYRKKYQVVFSDERKVLSEELEKFPEIEETVQDTRIIGDLLPNPRINKKIWNQIINIGEANDLLQSSFQAHIQNLKLKLNFKYIRFWNLFTKSMNLDPLATEEYNFEKVDSLLDFLIQENIFPFIDLRYKVRRIHKSVKEMLIFENKDFNFQINSEAWFLLIEQFIKHVNERYGKRIVDQWKFEFSFEYYSDSNDLEEIIQHYKETYEIIKKYSNAQIGGPSGRPYIGEKYDFRRDLIIFSKKGVKFDFLSYILYPYENPELSDNKNVKKITDENFFIESCQRIKDARSNTIYKDCKIYITEWSNTISNRNSLNDRLFKGSWLIKNLVELFDQVDAIAYWVGSDLFSEYVDSRDILHGSTGLLTRNGLSKSSLHAFVFLNNLLPEIYFVNSNLIVSYDQENMVYHGILYNYEAPSIQSSLMDEEGIEGGENKNIFPNRLQDFDISLPSKKVENFILKKMIVNEKSGDIFSKWHDFDIHNPVIDNDFRYWDLLCQPTVTFDKVRVNNKKVVHIKGTLNSNDFIYFELYPIEK